MKIEKFGMPFRRRPMQVGDMVVRVALLLLCLVMVSAYMTSGLLARYTTSAQASDTARVAKFDVQVTGTPQNVEINASVSSSGVYHITITNQSEVAVQYTLAVSDISAVHATFDQSSGTLAPGADPISRTLTLEVTDWDSITKDMSGEEDSVYFDFTITVDIQQIN